MTDVRPSIFEKMLDASGAHQVHVLIANYKRYIYVCVCVCVCLCVCVFDYGGYSFLGVSTMLLFMVAAE